MSFLTVEHLPLRLQQTITHRTVAAGHILFQQQEPTQAVFVVDLPLRGKAEGRGQEAEGKNCPESRSQAPA